MDITETASEKDVQRPGRDRGAEVLVEPGHRPGLDRTAIPGAHRVLVAFPQRLDEQADSPEVVGAVRVPHDHVAAADVWQGVDVGATESTPWGAQDAGTTLERDLRG